MSLLKETGYEIMSDIEEGSYSKVYKVRKANKYGQYNYYAMKKMSDLGLRKKYSTPLGVGDESEEEGEYLLGVADHHLKELEMLMHLNHKNLTDVVEIFFHKKSIYVIMDLYLNELTYLININVLSLHDIYNFSKQLVDVVNYLHSNDIAHLDIKSNNIMVDWNKNIKLIDMNLAHNHNFGNPPVEGICNLVYKPPEVIFSENEEEEFDLYAIDVWCVGYVVMEMLHGEVLFDTFSDKTIMKHMCYFIQNFKATGKDYLMSLVKDEYAVSDATVVGLLWGAEKMLNPDPKERVSISYIYKKLNNVQIGDVDTEESKSEKETPEEEEKGPLEMWVENVSENFFNNDGNGTEYYVMDLLKRCSDAYADVDEYKKAMCFMMILYKVYGEEGTITLEDINCVMPVGHKFVSKREYDMLEMNLAFDVDFKFTLP